jgi:thiamine pyrophosphokinase
MSKLIPRTHDDYVLNARLSGAAAGIDADTVFMAVLPLAHNYNLASPGILATFLAGGRVVLAPRADAETVFGLVARERVSVVAAAVPLVVQWLASDAPEKHDLSSLRVVQNGGARLAPELRLTIDVWVGDGDSLSAAELDALREAGVPVELASADKDESDTELAVLAAVRRGARDVTIVGALGGARVDHALANVTLLGHPALAGSSARILTDQARITLLTGPGTVEIEARPGDLVSLLPFGGDAHGVTTDELQFPLDDERLEAGRVRGLSNVRLATRARVSVKRGRLLIVESPATLSP